MSIGLLASFLALGEANRQKEHANDTLAKLRVVAKDWATTETLTGDPSRAGPAIRLAEEAKVRIRAIRKEGMDAAKKMKADNDLTEDGQKDHEGEVQKLTDRFVKEIDALSASKEEEVMKV